MNKNIVAIDPGISGGLAFYDQMEKPILKRMPRKEEELIDILRRFHDNSLENEVESVVVIEKIPPTTGKFLPESRIFVLAKNYGFLWGAAEGLGYKIQQVTPKEWQKIYNVKIKDRNKRKKKYKEIASELSQNKGVSLCTADALLILNWYLIKNNQIMGTGKGEKND